MHVAVFDTALEFERTMGMTNVLRSKGVRGVPTISDKFNVDLSRETKGYTYVPLNIYGVIDTFAVRSTRRGESYRATRSSHGLGSTQLRIRRGMSERAMKAAFQMV